MGEHEHADPLLSFQFSIEVDGLTGYFIEMTGLGPENEVVEHKITLKGKDTEIELLPGRTTLDTVTLKRGITNNMDFWTWREVVIAGKVTEARKAGTITMYDRAGNPAAKWSFHNGWPSKVSGPELKTDSNDYGVEEIAIVVEGITRTE